MSKNVPRLLHRRLAPWLVVPILLTLATGMAYRIGRSWFGMEKPLGSRILDVHTGEWMGTPVSLVYTLLVGGGLMFFVVTGARMLLQGRMAKQGPRRWHRLAALIFCLPLLVSAVTGVVYHFADASGVLAKEWGDILMSLHQGGWLGPALKPFYVLFLGLGLLTLAFSGLRMWRKA